MAAAFSREKTSRDHPHWMIAAGIRCHNQNRYDYYLVFARFKY